MNPLRDYRLLLALSAVALGCNDDAGLGGNQAGQGGGAGASAQGGSGNATAGASARGGTMAAAGTGGASTASGGVGTASGGASTGSGGKTDSAGHGGSGGRPSAGTGGSHFESGGAGAGTDSGAGGDAGEDTSSAGAGGSDAGEVVNDNATPGKGDCEGTTLGAVIDAIHQGWPELASIEWFYDPKLSGEGDQIFAFRTDQGFHVVFFHGSGDCPGGCINREYKYFETDEHCAPQEVGYYSKTFADPNCLRVVGKPLWGVPDHADVDSCGTLPPGLNETCPTDGCPIGLEPVRFYGVAGTSGPELCWCSLRCAPDPNVCPAGTACTSIADGPSNICSE